jgi:hypothetical protein
MYKVFHVKHYAGLIVRTNVYGIRRRTSERLKTARSRFAGGACKSLITLRR